MPTNIVHQPSSYDVTERKTIIDTPCTVFYSSDIQLKAEESSDNLSLHLRQFLFLEVHIPIIQRTSDPDKDISVSSLPVRIPKRRSAPHCHAVGFQCSNQRWVSDLFKWVQFGWETWGWRWGGETSHMMFETRLNIGGIV